MTSQQRADAALEVYWAVKQQRRDQVETALDQFFTMNDVPQDVTNELLAEAGFYAQAAE